MAEKKKEKKEKTKKKPALKTKGAKSSPGGTDCPFCSNKLRLEKLYDEYICDECERYIHRHLLGMEQKDRIALICPGCGGEPDYINEYSKHYCNTCKRHLNLDELESKRIPVQDKPTPSPPPTDFYLSPPPIKNKKGFLCKVCYNELEFIEQYERWYCSECQNYQ